MLTPPIKMRKFPVRPSYKHALMVTFSTLLCVLWSWYAGKDINPDQLNYHLYSGYQLVGDRVQQDFMAASIQGYQNPIAYLPFYLMVSSDWHSLAIGTVLALMHSICLVLIYFIFMMLTPKSESSTNQVIGSIFSLLLAFLAPVYLLEVGSTFADITTAIPVLAGIAILLKYSGKPRAYFGLALAGFLFGVAFSLKITNAIYVIPPVILILLSKHVTFETGKNICSYISGVVLGCLAIGFSWSYKLYQAYASPFFPYWNSWFKSPDFPQYNIGSYRFNPESFTDYLLFPFRTIYLNQSVYSEVDLPDIRILALLAVFTAWGVLKLFRQFRSAANCNSFAPNDPAATKLNGAVAFTITTYGLWLLTSANSRYGLALLLLIAPVGVAAFMSISKSRRLLIYLVGGLIATQFALSFMGATRHWNPNPWSAHWYNVDIPDRLKHEKFLYLSMQVQTASFLAPFLNAESSFVNLAGQTSLGVDRAGGARLKSLLVKYDKRTRMLFRVEPNSLKTNNEFASAINWHLSEFGLKVDSSDCELIVVHDHLGLDMAIEKSSDKNSSGLALGHGQSVRYLSCSVVTTTQNNYLSLDYLMIRSNHIFDQLEDACPGVFQPRRPHTDILGDNPHRIYLNTDSALSIISRSVFYSGWAPSQTRVLGSVEDFISHQVRVDCDLLREVSPKI